MKKPTIKRIIGSILCFSMIMCSAPVFAQQRGDVDSVFEQYQHIVEKINLEYGTSISIGEPCAASVDELMPAEEVRTYNDWVCA